jgi:hypothetical protein
MKPISLAVLPAAAGLALASLTSCAVLPRKAPPPQDCPAAREFITSVNYLRSRKELSLPEPEIRKVAGQVAEGCAGAANRFVQVTELLVRSGLGGRDAVAEGLRLARGTDPQAEVFRRVFRRAFLSEYLDLDLRASLAMANELSAGFAHGPVSVRRDFETLLDYCVDRKGFDLPRQRCGAFAARVAQAGADWKDGVAAEFIRTYEFLRSDRGPGLPTHQALAMAEELSASGPGAAENFTRGYRYALSKDGLDSPREAAVAFARQLTRKRVAPTAPTAGGTKPSVPATGSR